MTYVIKVIYRHGDRLIAAFVVPWKGRNGYTLTHQETLPKKLARFVDEPEAKLALDTLWDKLEGRVAYEIMPLPAQTSRRQRRHPS